MALRKKEILPSVAAIIFNDRGQVLLHKRRDVGKWSIISGHVEFGESVEEAIVREIKEELDTPSLIVRLIGVYSSPSTATYHYDDKTVHYVTSYFEAKLLAAIDPQFSNEETEAVSFFAIDQIPSDLALMNPYWLEDALQRRAQAFIR